jgi:hypothetical protein
MAIMLGQAALAPSSVVVIQEGGGISDNTAATNGLLQIFLTDDPPSSSEQNSWKTWLTPTFLYLIVAFFSLVGVITVMRWLLSSL